MGRNPRHQDPFAGILTTEGENVNPVILAACASVCFATAPVERWGVFEVRLRGPEAGNPYREVELSAVFQHGDLQFRVPGFWNGGADYRIRFSPPVEGTWQYETYSNARELAGHRGTFEVGSPNPGNHGPVEVFDTFYLRYADGTPYHQFGTTCYAWVHQTEELQEQTLKTLSGSPFNKIRFCVFPKSYTYNQNDPALYPFGKRADGQFDFDRPDPAFWTHFEGRILDLQRLGIEADIILWHPYDRWGFSEMSDEQDDRYLRYGIARLSAFRNVWWSLANEFDFMTDRPAGQRGNKQWEDWDRFFSILQKEDPHQRFRGIHNGRVWYDHTKPWVTHASLQSSDMHGGIRYREKYRKPVIYDECRYEGDIPQGWGNLTPQEMTQRFWLGTLSGCYVGHGETYKHPQDILWWSKGGVLHGQSPQRIQWLKDLMAQSPPFHELVPMGDDQGRFILAKPGEFYLVYCLDGRPQRVHLAGERPYKLDLLDPWEMTATPTGSAGPGEVTLSPPKSDVAYRLQVYQPGERLRPQAKIEASVTEGLAPLTVEFKAAGDFSVFWEFGDDTTSSLPTIRHTFAKPGIYQVKLTVTDAQGGVAAVFQEIAVDVPQMAPLLRVGFPDGDNPAVRLNGTARRTPDGGFDLPAGSPWGFVSVGDGVLENLRGLRSFTIMGWLKPESLEIGSGGNRILFCLNRDRSGIDLVCQPDGRLRLSVNQWPDRVQNDSAPGKLRVGRWTFFAVSYDATREKDNVCWYFSPPQENPENPQITFDRSTTYNVGSVATDIGPVVVGNFNETMRSYGLDRQFRGQIRSLQLYGSRVGGRGALSLEEIRDKAH